MSGISDLAATTTKAVKLPSGIELPYVEQGDPTGVPVVLLHGYSDSWLSYERLLPFLPPSLRVFALTQRGHGDADRPLSGYAPVDFAGDVAAFVEALGIEPAVVVGHSMGSTIAQQVAIDHPAKLRGLVLIGSFVDFAGNQGVRELESAVAALTDPIDPDFVRAFQEATLAQPVPPSYFDRIVAESLKMPSRVWKAALAGLLATNLGDDLSGIVAPTLVIWGDLDSFVFREEQEYLAAAIPNARLATYAGAGHALHWEEPARVAAEIAAFVEHRAG